MALGATDPARADEVYGRADVGIAISDFETEVIGTGGGGTSTLLLDSSTALGGRFGGAIGYRTDLPSGEVSLEGELSYRNIAIDTVTLSGAGLPTAITSSGGDASGYVLPILFNIRYDHDIGKRWQPYALAGVGPAIIDPGTDGLDGTVTGIAYQVGVGASVELLRGIELETGYRYMRASASDSLDDSTLDTLEFETDTSSHELLVGLSVPIWTRPGTKRRPSRVPLFGPHPLPAEREEARPQSRSEEPVRTASASPASQSLVAQNTSAPPSETSSWRYEDENRRSAATSQMTDSRPFGATASTSTRGAPTRTVPARTTPPSSIRPTTALATSTGATTGGFWVQVAAFQDVDVARSEASRFQARNTGVLGTGQPRIQQAYSANLGGDVFRVQFGPYAQSDATAVCERLGSCLVKADGG